MDATDAEAACFEAGIKFGTLYHQFAGTPVAPDSTDSLERAMEDAIENQPFCVSVTVTIHESRVREAIDHAESYTELTGALMDVQMQIAYEEIDVETAMAMEDGYPRMRVVDVSDAG